MNIHQEIIVEQHDHKIRFRAYDIRKVYRYEIGMEDEFYIPECAYRDYYYKEDSTERLFCKNQKSCINCSTPHFEEILIDGFYIETEPWENRSYIAELQLGIKVPVTEEIYNSYKNGFENDWISSDVKPIIIKSNDGYYE